MAALSAVLRRFKFDQEELRKSPVANVSAAPLEDNIYEWHCNIRQDDIIFHLILFFPPQYPYKSPSAEFVPIGFQYSSGATKTGKKGTQICLNIFSDFSNVHTEWGKQKGLGWSPAYTVQTVLMNVVAFLAETQAAGSSSHAYTHNLNLSKGFTCPDCGHCYTTPYPALDNEVAHDSNKQTNEKCSAMKTKSKEELSVEAIEGDDLPQLIDYISKERFQIHKPTSVDDIWGYGLAVSGTVWRPTLTSPCEFITGKSYYEMKKAAGTVQSVFKEELKLFLPLYIHPTHGSEIRKEFENTMRKVGNIMPKYSEATPIEDLVLKTIPNLLTATVVEFSKGSQHTSDNSLYGYFAFHRLFLWAIDTYPDLQAKIEDQVKAFVDNDDERSKNKVPYIAEWLMLVSGSRKYKWQDVAAAYLSESWKRSALWYVKDDAKLGDLDTPQEYRIRRTYDLTEVARKHLAFQATFLDVAMPAGMSREDVLKRYDENFGFPTHNMVQTMKDAFVNINTNMKNYQDWFAILKQPVLSDDELYTILVEAVRFSIVNTSYHWRGIKGGGWVQVLQKYKAMIQEAKGASGKVKTEATKDKRSSPGKSKSTARGKKRKAADSDVNDDDDDSLDTSFNCHGKARGTGKGKGGPGKRTRT